MSDTDELTATVAKVALIIDAFAIMHFVLHVGGLSRVLKTGILTATEDIERLEKRLQKAGTANSLARSKGITDLTNDFEDRLTHVSGAPGTHTNTYNGLDIEAERRSRRTERGK